MFNYFMTAAPFHNLFCRCVFYSFFMENAVGMCLTVIFMLLFYATDRRLY